MSSEELKHYRRMMVEANTQLGLVQLPRKIFGKMEDFIKTVAYAEEKKRLGEDPVLNYKKNLIRIQNLASRGISEQGKDGSVPSLDQINSIKQEIELDKKNLLGSTPLAAIELKQKAMEKFYQIEDLMESDPERKEQYIKELQELPLELLSLDAQHRVQSFN